MAKADELKAKIGLSSPLRERIDTAPPRIPDHEMLRRIGSGSYGEVWLARNTVGTWRAVKAVYRAHFKDARPYEREFSGIKKYEPISRANEGLVDVLQIGRNDAEGYFYYVMELADDASPSCEAADVRGLASPAAQPSTLNFQPGTEQSLLTSTATYTPRTLAHEIRARGRLTVDECITLGLTLNLALGHLHRSGLIHRDVKPSNIIFVNGVPKLADIGLVVELAEAESFVGTEGFIPPEGPNSPQADLYALGKVLYEASMGKDRQEFPEPATGLGLDAESKALMELNAVLLKACAPRPQERYSTAEEMNADLALLHSGKSVKNKHVLERRLKVARRVAIGIATIMVLGLFPYYLVIQEAQRARIAEADAKERLWHSYHDQAQALRLSGREGSRVAALKAIKQAAAIRPSLELRNEAVASMALWNFQVKKVWPPAPDGSVICAFDVPYERYVRLPTNGPPSIRSVENDTELMRLSDYTAPLPPSYYPMFEFSPDGRYLAAVGGTNMHLLDVWDLNSQAHLSHFEGRFCRTIAFSADSRLAAFSFADDDRASCPLEIYDLNAKRTIGQLEHGPGKMAFCARFNPVKNLLATCGSDSKEVVIWDLTSGKVTQRIAHPDEVWDLNWDPEGEVLATACMNRKVYLWSLAAPQSPTFELLGHEDGAVKVSFSFDGTFLASRGWDSTVRIWDPASGQQIFNIPITGYTLILSRPHYRFSNRGGPGDFGSADEVALYELTPSRECRLMTPRSLADARAETFDFSEDGKCLLSAHLDGVRIWNVASGKTSAFLPSTEIYAAVFGPLSDHCLVAGESGVYDWTLDRDAHGDYNRFVSAKLISTDVTSELLLSRDQTLLVFPAKDKVHILRLADGQLKTVPRLENVWDSTAMSNDGKLAVGWIGKTAHLSIFDLSSTNLLHRFSPKGPGRAAFSPDDHWLLVGDGAEYRLWNTENWQSAYTLPKVGNGVGFLGFMAFSPDGTVIALAQSRDTIRLIEMTSGRELATLVAPHAHDIGGLKFSPDGTQLAVLYRSGPIQLWNLRLIREQLAEMKLDWELPNRPATQASAR